MIDKVEIKVKGGDGGNGAISFRREKYVPRGGPDGGDGGDGGNVVIQADSSLSDLRELRHKGFYPGDNGANGQGKKKHGRNGADLILKVPVGTVVLDKEAGELIADLEQSGQGVIVAYGGKGGLGNSHFATPTKQAPFIAEKGQTGQEITVTLDLRLIADAGIIGFPNAGKSSLLAAASAAKPAIANYPFTTIEPVLGVVEVDQQNFILAEIPGLIKGSHLGKGLGHDFLHHALRTRVLIHLIDGTSQTPLEDMAAVNEELTMFDRTLGSRSQIVAVNKIDLPEVQSRKEEIRKIFIEGAGIEVYFISAATGQNVPVLMQKTWELLETLEKPRTEPEIKIFRPQPSKARFSVEKDGDIFVVKSPELERITSGISGADEDVIGYVRERLTRIGLDRALGRAGAKPGDKVRLGTVEWVWLGK